MRFHNDEVSWLCLIITASGGVGRCADMGTGCEFLSRGSSPFADRFSKEPKGAALRICSILALSNFLRVTSEQACDSQIKPAPWRESRYFHQPYTLQCCSWTIITDFSDTNSGFSRTKATGYMTSEGALFKYNFSIYALKCCPLVFQLWKHFMGLGWSQSIH